MKPISIKKSYQVRFSTDGLFCVAIGRDVTLWNIASRSKSFQSRPCPHPSHIDFSLAGEMIAVKSTSGRVLTLESTSGRVLEEIAELWR